MKERHIDSLQGWVDIARMRYYCRRCGRGYYPLDERLRLSKHSRMSEQKEKQLALLSVRLPYEEAKKVYEELTRQSTSRMTAHRTVQRLGGQVAEKAPKARKRKGAQESLPQNHITADGTLVHIRGEGWKEAKVGACYAVDSERRAQDIGYTGTLESRERFGSLLYDLCGKPEMSHTKKMAFVADAAGWLATIQQVHFPGATLIVDFWHAAEYLSKVARSFYGEGTNAASHWAEDKVRRLRRGRWKSILRALKPMKPKTPEQKEILSDTVRYFLNHGHKMNYPVYEQMGFHIGSGIAEGGCKYVIQSRFKQAGMRWSRNGAERLLRLRISYLNSGDIPLPECSLN